MTLATKKIQLDHGTGAVLSSELVDFIAEILGDIYVGEMEDSSVVEVEGNRIAITTDSFVVDPPFFGNGDIGKIAVCGTVNDLAVSGASPRYLTLGMILETGLPFDHLYRVLTSIRETAREACVKIVCGDTKVVREGEADQLYLNTSGVGFFSRDPLRMDSVRPGDTVILSGPLGNHTIHLLSIREGLGFESRVLSDCAPLNNMIDRLFSALPAGSIHSMRDVTRGGLSAVLHEYSNKLNRTITVETLALPIQQETAMAADMLGIDPLHCANEGCLAIFIDPSATEDALTALQGHEYGRHAAAIGHVTSREGASVTLRDSNGRESTLQPLRGAELPRLC